MAASVTGSPRSCSSRRWPRWWPAPAGRMERPVSPDDRTAWEAALVVVPTYNEADNIEAILKAVTTSVPEASLLVVDDGSPDGTGELVEKAAEDAPRIHLLRGQGKLGLGHAYVTGFTWGLEHGYGLFVEMDADFSHDPAAIPDLLRAAGEADVVVGSRYIPGGGGGGGSKRRHLLSRAGNVYARLAPGFGAKGATAAGPVRPPRSLLP